MARTNTLYNDNVLKLGLFSPNCQGGLAITTVAESWDATWDNNLALAQMCDEAGLEFILPIGRWKGHGGPSDFHRETLETLTWSAGLLAATQRLSVLATVHAPMIHPIVAAKQMATVDHISHGRFGLNLVCGWNQDEFEMFGKVQLEHDERYVYGQEWLDVVRTLWNAEEPVDHSGQYFQLPGLIGRPAPYDGEPVIFNAGFSPAGRAFAVRNCDFLFTSLVDLESGARDVQTIQTAARAANRDIGIFASGWVVCRPTEKEAQEYHHHYAIENADWEAAEHLMTGMGLHGQSFPADHYQRFRERFSSGHGGYPLVGTPDQIADELVRISEIGLSGLAFGFVDYLAELPYFRDEVLPRLEARGVRQPVLERAA
jgi:FMNH2-dependent dimethyl sulfone monooxygenase